MKQAAVAKSEEGRPNKKQTLNRGVFACARYGAVNSTGKRSRVDYFFSPELYCIDAIMVSRQQSVSLC